MNRSERFTKELKELLAKHKAEIEIDTTTDNWGHHVNSVMKVYMDTIWEEGNGDTIEDYTVIDLGSSVRP